MDAIIKLEFMFTFCAYEPIPDAAAAETNELIKLPLFKADTAPLDNPCAPARNSSFPKVLATFLKASPIP